MLEVNQLYKQYGTIKAVQELSFTIKTGEVVGLLGANGAGKSTTMNMLCGCLPPSGGSVHCKGIDMIAKPIEAKRHIGYLPEIPPLYSDMTVTEQLRFAARLRGLERRQIPREIERVSDMTNICDMSRRMVKQLSKGYRQRVGMAQALIGKPEILVFDEPAAGLDPKQIKDIRELIKRLKEEHTIIISSHILAEIASVCSRLLIMNRGELLTDSSPEDLSREYGDTNKIRILSKGNEEMIVSALNGLDGLKDFSLRQSPRPGLWDIELEPEQNRDIRTELFFRFADKSCPIIEMKSGEASLEELFLRLTTQ